MPDAAAEKPKAQSKQAKAGLTFAVSRIDKKLRTGRVARQVSQNSSVYLTAVVEHVLLKVIGDMGAEAAAKKAKRVTDTHIVAAVRSDPDLARAFAGYCFSSVDTVPKAMDRILPDDEQKERQAKLAASKTAREEKKAEDAKKAAAAASATA